MPQMDDPNFARSVVLLCQHDTDEGAFGLVVNRPVDDDGEIVPQTSGSATEHELEVWIGGPVEPERSWILMSATQRTRRASRAGVHGVFLSTSAGVLQTAASAPRIVAHATHRRLRRLGTGTAGRESPRRRG